MTLLREMLGVDVAKGWIDIFALSTGRRLVATTKTALAGFAKAAAGAFVIFEGSGGYERTLTAALAQTGVPCARVTPPAGEVVDRATGRLAKTDRVDAEILARTGQALDLPPSPPEEPDRARFADFMARRDDLGGMTRAEKNRPATAHDPWIARQIAGVIYVLERHLAKLEAEIEALLTACERLSAPA